MRDDGDGPRDGELTILEQERSRSRLSGFSFQGQLDHLAASLDPGSPPGWPIVGLHTAFPILSQELDGYRNGLYIYAGGARMGKSTLLLQHAFDLARLHEDVQVLYVSLDQPVRDVNLRLVAMAGRCSLDYLLNPLEESEEKYEARKQRGLEQLGRLRERIHVVDESQGMIDLPVIRGMIRELRAETDGPLFLFLDPIFKLRPDAVPLHAPLDDRVGCAARDLRALALQERVGVLCTTRLDRGSGDHRPTLAHMEDQSNLLYEADAIFLLYCEAANDASTPFLEWEWGTDDLMVPIYEVLVAKNRMGSFAGRLFYRFYQSFSMFKECSSLEIDNFRRMLSNLEAHSPEGQESREPELPKVEDVSAT